ncbi:uncharacterized protein MELLADRAFT_78128 [Melampsora larici-populina 98AG31]|uniref:Heme haloperoxidase family profile domain-containing protein n=1 Tax=Melampsora larici-populina (strain 98AG31 / pathotype 3-4-7) TaxID=747676 RepID=F4RQH2_MELLP|nr:uncharacterized protein MELLADRAFT_78128 [Melampsora larici-populina 98AG31]EGG05409.1 hypothetical protein MELLADRAFT_78128 [Melampsora larici-populina 98AG31]
MKRSSMESFVLLSIALITQVRAFPQYAAYNHRSAGNSNELQNAEQGLILPSGPMGTDHNSGLLGLGIPSSIDLAPLITVGRKIIPDAEHAFMEPGPGDIRGLCPGLNIIANHGYIPRNGITDMIQLAYGLEEGLGMKMSIGRSDSRTDGPLTNLLGRAPGLFSAEAHDKYEIDGSLAADDAYFSADKVSHFNGTRWNRWREMAVDKYQGIMSIEWNSEVRYMQNAEIRIQIVIGFAFYAGQNFISTIMPSSESDGKPGPALVDSIDTFFGYHKDSTGQYARQDSRYPPGSSGVWYRRTIPHTLAEFVEAGIASIAPRKYFISRMIINQDSELTLYSFPRPIFGANNGGLGTWSVDPLQINSLADVNLSCMILNRLLDVDDTRYEGLDKDALKLLLENITADLRQNVGC